MAVISEDGLIYHEVIKGYMDTKKYLAFLDNLYEKVGKNRKVTYLFDGLSVHKTKDAYEWLDSKGWLPCLNIAYSPQFNAIELSFQVIKHRYRLKLLKNRTQRFLGNNVRILSTKDLVESVLQEYEKVHALLAIIKSLKNLEEAHKIGLGPYVAKLIG